MNHCADSVVSALAGTAPAPGIVSNARQFSRSLISPALQLGEQIEGCGVWRALSGSGASLGGGTVGGDVVGEVAAQPTSSSTGSISVSCGAGQFLPDLGVDGADVVTVLILQNSISLRCLARGRGRRLSLAGQLGAGLGRIALAAKPRQGLPGQERRQHQGQRLPGVGLQPGHHGLASQS
ncbi:hypothetical protein BI380_00375 [Delftia tsuruhatensis]|uniref:Uncharacterized protein n=1 Tax=Delftia tsuruhatensis TaxID=180282 RepID=A0ABM6DYC5_9BURK|nr:hypothetical protein BI380_00375 [Delftia tsuruhatensis]